MPTRTTGLFDVPDIEGGPIIVRIELRNYRSRSSQVEVDVNRFLSTGRRSPVLNKQVTVPASGANFVELTSLQGSVIEVTVDGSSLVKPTVSVVQNIRNDGTLVLLLINPRLFTTL